MSQVWFGYMKALQRYELTSCLQPLRLKVTKLFGCPQDDVMSLYTKFGYDMLKSC